MKDSEKYESIELDISSLDRNILEKLIIESCNQDLSVNKIIENLLRNFLKNHETSNI